MSPERLSLEVNGVPVAFNPNCVDADLLYGVFIGGEYEIPEALSGLKGREVVDVGANVGDSALYFVLNGARKVIAVEPLPKVAKCAEENVRLSSATDKVKVINAALSSGPVNVPCDYDDLSLSGGFSTLKGSGPAAPSGPACHIKGLGVSACLGHGAAKGPSVSPVSSSLPPQGPLSRSASSSLGRTGTGS